MNIFKEFFDTMLELLIQDCQKLYIFCFGDNFQGLARDKKNL